MWTIVAFLQVNCIHQLMNERLYGCTMLHQLLKKDGLDNGDCISWAAFHTKNHPLAIQPKANIALLPIFYENAHSPTVVKHAMTVAMHALLHLNPDQVPVIAMDPPLYSMAKQIQWSWPDTMGTMDKYIVMLGGLHTEMAVLNILGEWFDGSGWTTAPTEASITTSGKAEALISASHVKRSRYAHKVTLAALHELQSKAYEIDMLFDDTDNPPDFPSWCKQKAEQCPQFQYWSITMRIESTLLQFVRSQREGNFFLYIDTLGRLMPWFFTLDHVYYARWLPVHIRDLLALQQSHPYVHREFMKRKFVIQRSFHAFSPMPMDQSHKPWCQKIHFQVSIMKKPITYRNHFLHMWNHWSLCLIEWPPLSRG